MLLGGGTLVPLVTELKPCLYRNIENITNVPLTLKMSFLSAYAGCNADLLRK